MTLPKEQRMLNVYAELLAAAREIAQDDPELLLDYDGFERVLWPDDNTLKEHRLSRANYGDLIEQVFVAIKKKAA
jgi:hypothetical protein